MSPPPHAGDDDGRRSFGPDSHRGGSTLFMLCSSSLASTLSTVSTSLSTLSTLSSLASSPRNIMFVSSMSSKLQTQTYKYVARFSQKDNTFHISRTKYDNNSFRADNLSLHILTHCPRFRQIVTIHPLERHRVLKTGDSFVRRRFEKPQYTAYLLLAYE